MNKQVTDLHPTVPHPNNLLSSLPPSRTWYTVLDLKDAFFCLLLATNNQEYYTFEWKDPYLGITGQLTWTHLPQGFKNSPTIFDEDFHQDLATFWAANPQVTLLQYGDNLLSAPSSRELCLEVTKRLLTELGELGYRASAKAQICTQQVSYLGYLLKGGKMWLRKLEKKLCSIFHCPPTRNKSESFIGTAGFCCLWIPGFAEIEAPLYPLTKNNRHLMPFREP